jgi:hypothetical protein
MNKSGLIGMLAVVVLLSGFAIWQHLQLSAAAQAESAEKARSTELQKKVESLEQEVTTLKETADYYFQQGVDQQSAGNLQEAKTAFEAVVAKFPMSSLVGTTRQRLAAVNEAIEKAEVERYAEMQRQAEEKEKLTREQGEPIDYKLFYARSASSGLPIDKRFRFTALIHHNLVLYAPDYSEYPNLNDQLICEAAFDDEAQHQQFLLGKDLTNRTVVASMGADGNIRIHKVE